MTKKNSKQKLSNMLLVTLAFIGLNVSIKAQNTYLCEKDNLKITYEIAETLKSEICLFLENVPDEMLINYGIKTMSQLFGSQLGNPIPVYILDNQDLKFAGLWRMPVMSEDEFIALATIKKTDNEQYKVVDFGATKLAKIINDYKDKDLIIGILRVFKQNADYLYIQKDNKDIFLKMSDLKSKEYSLSDIIDF